MHVNVFTDHNSLVYLLSNSTKFVKLMRWSLALQMLDVEIKYKKEKKEQEKRRNKLNVIADTECQLIKICVICGKVY